MYLVGKLLDCKNSCVFARSLNERSRSSVNTESGTGDRRLTGPSARGSTLRAFVAGSEKPGRICSFENCRRSGLYTLSIEWMYASH